MVQNKENLSERDGILYQCRRDLQLFISLQEEQPFIIDEEAPEKIEANPFSKLVYLQIAMLNNRGVILHSIGKEKEAQACFEMAYQERQYDFSINEEQSKICLKSSISYIVIKSFNILF